MLAQMAAGGVSDSEIGGITGSAGVEPGGDFAGAVQSAAGKDVVVELCRQAEFIGVFLAPLFDQGREHFLGAGLAAEMRQFVEQMELGEVASGKFRVQAAEEQLPPDRREGGDLHEGMVVAEVGEGIGPEPVLALFCPVSAGAAASR